MKIKISSAWFFYTLFGINYQYCVCVTHFCEPMLHMTEHLIDWLIENTDYKNIGVRSYFCIKDRLIPIFVITEESVNVDSMCKYCVTNCVQKHLSKTVFQRK